MSNLFQGGPNVVTAIHMENVDKSTKLPSEIMEELLAGHQIPKEKQVGYTSSSLQCCEINVRARISTRIKESNFANILVELFCFFCKNLKFTYNLFYDMK